MRAWNRRSAFLLVVLALVIVLKVKRLLGEERGMESQMYLQAEVLNQLAKEDRFQNLRVEAEDRTVRLRGTVAVLEDWRQAVQKASEVKDVRIAVSHIKVETERIDDGLLLRRLRERLAGDENGSVRLEGEERGVTIEGSVRHDAHRSKCCPRLPVCPAS